MALRSYGIAFLGCLVLTSINAIIDISSPYEQRPLTKIVTFHLLSALGYAIPVSLLVFYVIRNQVQKVRLQKAFQVVLYISSIIIGGGLGWIAVAILFVDAQAGLDGIIPMLIGTILGAFLLPLVVYVIRNRTR